MICRSVVSLIIIGRGLVLGDIRDTICAFDGVSDWHGELIFSSILHGRLGSSIIMSGVFIGSSWRDVSLLSMFLADRYDCFVVGSHWDMEQDDDAINVQSFSPKGAFDGVHERREVGCDAWRGHDHG
jgi:hypothetical protein